MAMAFVEHKNSEVAGSILLSQRSCKNRKEEAHICQIWLQVIGSPGPVS